MPIQIGQHPGHSFDEPLGLLSDCHRRIEHFLNVLATVAERAGGPLTDEHRAALDAALRYFAVAAPKHTADEEASLFPRLRESRDPAVVAALTALERLEHDHDEADAHHAAVDALVRRWIENDRLADEEAAELRRRLALLQELYRRHIAVEDREVFPAAARALDASALRSIGREMAERRQVDIERVRRFEHPGADHEH